MDLDEDSTILAPVETGDIETAIFHAAPYEGVAASARIPTERVSGMAPCVDPRRKPSAALGALPPEDTVQPPPQEDWKQYMRDTIRESLADIMRSGLLATPERRAAPSRRREEERHDSPRRREDMHHESPRRRDERRPEDRRSESPRYMRNEVLLPAHVVRDEDDEYIDDDSYYSSRRSLDDRRWDEEPQREDPFAGRGEMEGSCLTGLSSALARQESFIKPSHKDVRTWQEEVRTCTRWCQLR